MKFYYENKNEYFVNGEVYLNLCCNRFLNLWTSGEYDIEVYKNGIRYFPYKSNPNIHKIHKQCPFCGEDIKTEKVKDINLKYLEVYPYIGRCYY